MRGKNGFGYDPIFIPLNRKITFGQMKSIEKCKIDHRFKAFKKIKKFFKLFIFNFIKLSIWFILLSLFQKFLLYL